MYQLFATANSSVSTPITLVKPPAFSPPGYVIWANALLLLSGFFSIAAALVAILQQQWAQRYIMVTQQPSHTPPQRARIRAIFVNETQGPDAMPGNSLPAFYLPLSVGCYIGGGLVYLFNVNRTVFVAVVWLAGFHTVMYGQDTVKAIYKRDTLFYAPFTPLLFRLHLCILYAAFQICSCLTFLRHLRDDTMRRYRNLSNCYCEGFFKGRVKEAEEIILKKSPDIDARILEWTFQSCLGEDNALEKFFEVIPGFFDSKVVINLGEQLQNEFRTELGRAFHGFLDRTFSSDSVSESVRSGRLVICLNAARAALGSNGISEILDNILNERWHEALESVEVGHSLRCWGDKQFSSHIRRIIAHIISCVRERDGRWIALAKDEFGLPDHVFQDNVAQGDSASLAILIYITRQRFHSDFPSWGPDVLRKLSHFDISNSLPELQQGFCALWDEIFQELQKSGRPGSTSILILTEIRDLYLTLRPGADASLTTYADLTTDDDIPLEPSCSGVDRGPTSDPSFPTPDPPPSNATTLPTAEPTYRGTPISDSSHPAPLEGQRPLATYPYVTPADTPRGNVTTDISTISDLAKPIPPSTPGGGPVHHRVRETDIIPPVISGSQSIPNPMPVVSRDTISAAPRHSSIDSTVSRAHSIRHTLESPSSPSTPAPLPILADVSDQHVTQSIGTASAHADSCDQNSPIPMEVIRYPLTPLSAASGPGIGTHPLRREDHQHDLS